MLEGIKDASRGKQVWESWGCGDRCSTEHEFAEKHSRKGMLPSSWEKDLLKTSYL